MLSPDPRDLPFPAYLLLQLVALGNACLAPVAVFFLWSALSWDQLSAGPARFLATDGGWQLAHLVLIGAGVAVVPGYLRAIRRRTPMPGAWFWAVSAVVSGLFLVRGAAAAATSGGLSAGDAVVLAWPVAGAILSVYLVWLDRFAGPSRASGSPA